ncbi:MAG: hypothetical protein JHC84_13510 [Solirubrobacteraceae bacterium]|nr:hypothetical protein [Solirubrobacteraceae bacterium]
MASSVTKVGLIALMAIGSVMMWIGAPVGWIYVAAQVSGTAQVSMSAIVVILIGIPTTMYFIGKGLGRLNGLYGELTGTTNEVQIRAPWMRSMRDERDLHRPRTVLDVVMVVSVAIAGSAFGIWFMFFAEGGGI